MKFSSEELIDRWPSVRYFVLIGSLCVVAGGMVAAVTGPLDLHDGSWLAAYLVLVGGVAQIGLGLGQSALAQVVPDPKLIHRELLSWNLGNGVVVIGSLIGSAILTSVGGLILAVALWSFLTGVRLIRASAPGVLLVVYRGLATFVLLSIPVGLAMSWIRHA
ncbi:MAG: hypothetical protein WBF71_03935 [Microthrixaceae bacterium]